MYVSAKWKWVWNVCIVWEVRSLLKGLTGLQNQRDVIYVNDPTRECPGASLWCVNGFPALLFLCRVAATTWCGCVWGAEASGKQRWMVALAAVPPYYDRPPCRAPACLPASSDSSVGGSSAASTARPPHHGWKVGCCWSGDLNPDVWNNVDGGTKCKWGGGGGVFEGWRDRGAKIGDGPGLEDGGHAGKIRVNSGADEFTSIFSIFLGQLHSHWTGRQQLCRIGDVYW